MSVLRRSRRLIAGSLVLVGAGLGSLPARVAFAGPFDLDDEEEKKDEPKKKDEASPVDKRQPVLGAPPPATIKLHPYSLLECLALADRNHPNLWAARARLSAVHAQLDEATYTDRKSVV